jgi:large subunit ribosomal protein L25
MEMKLRGELRGGTGKGAARKLRAAGRVPAILYGHGMEPVPMSVSALDLLHVFHAAGGSNLLVDLEVNGDTHLAIAREVQRDYLHGRYIHVDFLAVRRDEKITVSVEVHEVGEAEGVKAGGVVEHHLREVQLECLPTNVPDAIEVDISALEIGDMIRAGDLMAPENVEILTDPETPIISIVTPAVLQTEVDLTLPGEEVEELEEVEEVPEGEEPVEGEAEAEAAAEEEGAGAESEPAE